jgi:RNA-directed DNA polymerase
MAARSVDSECKSRVIEPRKNDRSGSLCSQTIGGSTVISNRPDMTVPAGSESRADAHRDSLETWESRLSPWLNAGIQGLPAKQCALAVMLRFPSSPSRKRTTRTRKKPWYRSASDKRSTTRRAVGSLSILIVPFESRETDPREPVSREGGCRAMESLMGNTERAQERESVLTKQQRIAQATRQHPKQGLTSLNHYLDMDWMREAYRRVRKDSAPGYDGQTVQQYGEHLEENLASLLERAKSGSYIAPPVRRVFIPKGTGGKDTRPIGIPTTEDKVLQRAITMILEPVFEQSFYDFSYAFRPGRSPHQALEYLWEQINSTHTTCILDVDVRKFFDTMVRAQLREMFGRRVRDGVITRLLDKWLKAGVLEGGGVWYPEQGTPQGGVISPLLSNIYLHVVLDRWFAQIVTKRLRGRAFMVRFADDCVMGFEYKQDADLVYRELPKRLEQYGLSLHPEKTRLIPFRRPRQAKLPGGKDGEAAGTFDFLGFTHYWGKSMRGSWVLKRKTAQGRLTRGLQGIRQWCRRNRHKKVREQFDVLKRKLEGHYAYYGITGNGPWLEHFREEVKKIWGKWLSRRSRSRKGKPWEWFDALIKQHFLFPPARVVHSIYTQRNHSSKNRLR